MKSPSSGTCNIVEVFFITLLIDLWFQALQILDGLPYDIIRTGYSNGGFCSRLSLVQQVSFAPVLVVLLYFSLKL